jgi:hypothetical protein
MKKEVFITLEHPETGEELELAVNFTYYYDPGRYYMPNGDPGYPPEQSFELVSVKVLKSDNGSEELPDWATDELIEQEVINSGALEHDSDDYEEGYYYDDEDGMYEG